MKALNGPPLRDGGVVTDVHERVDLNLLNVFDVVMTERHVTRAAEHMNMTQSAVSNALNRLRKQFEDQLFVKGPRGVIPTPKAVALWPRIHKAIEELHDTVQPHSFDALHAAQKFRMSMADLAGAILAPHLYRNICERAPQTSLFFIPHDPILTASRVMRGEVDFAVSIAPPRVAVVEIMPLWSDPYIVAGRSGHPLLQRKFTLNEFCNAAHLLVNLSGTDDYPSAIDDELKNRGLARNVRLSVNQFSIVASILRESDLIAILPARLLMVPGASDGIAIRPMPFCLPDAAIYLSWHQRSNAIPAQQWLKRCIVDATATLNVEAERRISDAMRMN